MDDKYRFDKQHADRAIKFIESYICHYVDDLRGQPFILLDWQRQLITDVYSWRKIDTSTRKYSSVYVETGKGCAKSMMLSAIGIYELLAANREAPEIYSCATDYVQANVTFEVGKKLILNSPKLLKMVDDNKLFIKQFAIEYPKNNGTWKILSGTAEGRHGLKPTCVLWDELHEQGADRKLYDAMRLNLRKRKDSCLWICTNAGSDKNSLCYQLHEEAERVINGTSKDDSLYALIYAAPKTDPIDDPNTWKKAIPSLGVTISVDDVAAEAQNAKRSPAAEAAFRRFFLTQWVQGSAKWLDMSQWDQCTKPFNTSDVANLPCYLALDMSQNDDISSLAMVFVGEKQLYFRTKSWIPKQSAEKWQEQDGTPYKQWAEDQHITILPTDTVDDQTQKRIAKYIVKLSTKLNVKCLAYDRYKASRTISLCERAGITCIDVKQTLDTLSPACFELERRLKEGSISIQPNPCTRWQASNVEIMTDRNGLIRPIKEAQKGKYAGRRGTKIDSIVALVTALTQVQADSIAEGGNSNEWQGELLLI